MAFRESNKPNLILNWHILEYEYFMIISKNVAIYNTLQTTSTIFMIPIATLCFVFVSKPMCGQIWK